MAEVTIPSGPARLLDVDRLSDLLQEAISAAARELRGKPVEQTELLVYRRSERAQVSWESVILPAPAYRQSIWDIRQPAAKCTEARALTDYLWDAGALPKKISQTGDGVPGKDDWADFVWVELVQATFLNLCAMSATRRLSETGVYEPWHIDPAETRAAAQDVALAMCSQRRSVRALCPVWAHMLEGVSVSLGSGISLRKWTLEERCLFLTRYHHEYLEDDPLTWVDGALFEVNVAAVPDEREAIVRAVTRALDLAKWALMAAADSASTVGEGGIVLRSPSGWRGPTIRRQDSLFGRPGSQSGLLIDASVAERASHLISGARDLMGVAPELDAILWFLGRSQTSATSRDSLLEAAIGLESLLVPDRGESTYKFRLHGAALLSSIVSEDVDADLKRIYELRSKAAHGSARDEAEFERLAPRSRFLLAKAIVAAVHLRGSGELRPNETGGDLGKAVGELVRRRCLVPLAAVPTQSDR